MPKSPTLRAAAPALPKKVRASDGAKVAKASRSTELPVGISVNGPPTFVEPMKALGVGSVLGEDWLLEIKYDGFRALAVKSRSESALWSRTEKPLTDEYPEIADALDGMDCTDCILDGEIVALDDEGRPRFQLLQNRAISRYRTRIFYYVFDILRLNGRSLIEEPIEVRKEVLKRLLKKAPSVLKESPIFEVGPADLLEEMRAKGLEGIVAKRRGSRYEPGKRSGAWVKQRIAHDQEFVIGGYTEPQGTRSYFGAILVGYYEGGQLRYAGKVGTGFDAKRLKSLYTEFESILASECPFVDAPRMANVHWVEPRLVAQIKFSEWTNDSQLRQPVFLGLRADKRAREVVREVSAG